VDAARRELWRQLTSKQRVAFKGTRWLLLKNPWNLNNGQKERLSTLVRWNSPLVRAWYLKESFQLFWTYKQPWRAKQHLLKWMNPAMRSKPESFKKFVDMFRSHLDGVLAWTQTRLSNGAVEGVNNKIKSISHRSFGFRSVANFIAAIYHCCAGLPLPLEGKLHFSDRNHLKVHMRKTGHEFDGTGETYQLKISGAGNKTFRLTVLSNGTSEFLRKFRLE